MKVEEPMFVYRTTPSARKITVSPRIKALSDVPTTEEDFDYKNDFVTATENK